MTAKKVFRERRKIIEMMKNKKIQIGELPPRYSFALNPHEGTRCSKCPKCERLTYPRKFPLLIYIDGFGPLVLGKTCRYCTKCEFIIAHQDELESTLAQMMSLIGKENIIGNNYFVIGTVERKHWQKHLDNPSNAEESLKHTADFKAYFDIQFDPGGWYFEGEK